MNFAEMDMAAISERILSRVKKQDALKRRWAGDVPNEDFDLDLLPTHNTFDYMAKRYAKENVQITTQDQLAPRPIDQPEKGIVAVMPRDPREAKEERPLVYADYTEGRYPVLMINPGGWRLQQIKEHVDELRHYGQDTPIIEPPKVDMNEVWQAYLEELKKKAKGASIHGASTGHRRFQRAKSTYGPSGLLSRYGN